MPFAEFMHYALYAPHVGYYTTHRPLGKDGDFITAPELTPLFGYTLANQCRPILDTLNKPIIFEFGAGSGQLCIDILTALHRIECLPTEYHILEVSPTLKEQQKQHIQRKIPELASRVKWLSSWPDEAFEGVILANEVLDAMPVHRFLKTNQGIQTSMVHLNNDDTLKETFIPCTDESLLTHLASIITHDVTPYLSEVNLFIDGWLLECAAMLSKGLMLIVDYGFPAHEYYHSDRHQGTLMCHARHKAHTNPFLHPGKEDITAHVDFTHVAEAAHKAGFHVAGYTNQASFLLANDLLNLLIKTSEEAPHYSTQQAVKQLIQPNEMGELFKVIALTKQLDVPLTGFQLHDKRASL